MQTFLVYMRQPQRLFHELGPRGFATFFLVVGGNAFVALVHPIFVVGLCWRVAFGAEGWNDAALCVVSVVAGYVQSVALAWRGLSFRGWPDKLRILAWTPLHCLLLSGAAWWAAIELTHAPFPLEQDRTRPRPAAERRVPACRAEPVCRRPGRARRTPANMDRRYI
jgi:hypothetical protein